MARQDPLRGFRFVVEIDQIAEGGFMRVKGLSREVKVESHREGGVNDYEHKLITQVSYPSLVLERGLALEKLWQWALDVAEGRAKRRTIFVRLQDEAGDKAWAWVIEKALPVKWSCSDLDATSSSVVMESVEFAHHGLRKGT
jgi:phage tail-like protein